MYVHVYAENIHNLRNKHDTQVREGQALVACFQGSA